MPDKTSADLAIFRLEQAEECLQGAKREIAAGSFKNAANRSYYSIFSSMKAVLALDKFDSKNHGNIIGRFSKDYIKTGIFPVKYSDVIKNAFDVRNDSDYKDFYIVSKDDVTVQTENAQEFLEVVREYTMNRIKQEHESKSEAG